MRPLLTALVAIAIAAALSLGGTPANAQGAACSIFLGSPVTDSADTSYTLSSADNCKFLAFTNAGAVTVTPPDPASLPKGFTVYIKSTGAGGVTFGTPPNGKLLDGTNGPVTLTQGTGMMFRSNGTAFYSLGLGIKHP